MTDHSNDFDPQSALNEVRASRAAMAETVAKPDWYAPLYGVAFAITIYGALMRAVGFVVLGVILIRLAQRQWRKHSGVRARSILHGRTKIVALTLAGSVLLVFLAGHWLQVRNSPFWLPIALSAGAGVLGAFASRWARRIGREDLGA